MVWAKLDDEILDNPKIAKAGVFGFTLHVAAITWCCRNLSDGFIPSSRVHSLCDWSGIHSEILSCVTTKPKAFEDSYLDAAIELGAVDPIRIARHLVNVSLWREDKERDGYWLNDFLKYNPSREKVLAERARGRERKERSRAEHDENPDHVTRGIRNASRNESATASPGPVPVPNRSEDLSLSSHSFSLSAVNTSRSAREEIPADPVTDIRASEQAYQRAYEAGIREGFANGEGYAMPESQRGELHQAILAHSDKRRGEALLEWIHAAAADFAEDIRKRPAEQKYYSSFGPRGLLKWLNDRAATLEAKAIP